MNETSTVVVTGTALHLGPHVAMVPSLPPEPTGPSRVEDQRRAAIVQSSGLPGPDPSDSWEPGPGTTVEDIHARYPYVVLLQGNDLPPDQERVQARGDLAGRSVEVHSWTPEPWSTSAWEEVDVEGAELETAKAVIDSALSVSEGWPLVGLGISPTTSGRTAAVIEVDRVISEIRAWMVDQPPGSVKLISFITED